MNLTRLPLAIAAVSSIAFLAACEPEPEVVGELADPDRASIEELDPAALPPMEERSAIYRCADNSVVYVTYFTDNSRVAVSTESNGAQTYLPNADADAGVADMAGNETAGEPATSGPATFSGEGYTLVGTGDSIEYGTPGGSPQTCRS